MLGWRLPISAVLIAAFTTAFVYDHKAGAGAPLLLGLCLALAVRGVWEMVALLRTRSFHPNFLLTALLTCGVIGANWAPYSPFPIFRVSGLGLVTICYAFAVLALFLSSAIRFDQPGKSLETLGAELLIVSYVGVLLSVTAQLRWVAGPDAGYLVLGSLIIAVKCGDTGAYTLGRLFGKRKMVPWLSPGKTWMGALGALLGAGLGAWAWLQWATPHFNAGWQPGDWYWVVLYGVVVGVAGLVGDLCESLIKRDVGQKDSATLLPGFGGLLDLLDSVIYAGPVAYVLWKIMPLIHMGLDQAPE